MTLVMSGLRQSQQNGNSGVHPKNARPWRKEIEALLPEALNFKIHPAAFGTDS